MQSAGDTVFVPGGWWHAVLNLEDTVAMTQNFCSRANFKNVWREARSGRKKMSVKWLKRLHEYHPDLAQVAARARAFFALFFVFFFAFRVSFFLLFAFYSLLLFAFAFLFNYIHTSNRGGCTAQT